MPKDLREAFHPLLRAMKNWEEGIFNYFDGRHTNAYTESANAQVKEITRKAPRAKFDTIEAKVIQGHRLQHQREVRRLRSGDQPTLPRLALADEGGGVELRARVARPDATRQPAL